MAANDKADEARDLMGALTRGERHALARLIVLYGPGLRAFAAQVLHHSGEAEDVVQEVFVKVWQNADRYDPAKAAVSTWIWRIARNHCIDRNRRTGMRRFLGLESAPELTDEAPAPEDGLNTRQRLTRTQSAIAELPDRQRQALLLKALGGLSTAEIADTMGTKPGAVEQLLVRARATLRRRIAELEGEET